MSFWSEIRDNAFDSIGITKDVRDELQPLVNQVATYGGNPAPTDGYVPPNKQGIGGSLVLPSNLNFMNQKILGIPAWIFVAIVLALVAVLVMKGIKK